MIKETIEITGWKWATFKAFEASETKAMSEFNLPRGEKDATSSIMQTSISYTSKGTVDFYYIASNSTSQLKQTLGNPIVFDVTIDTDK